MAATSPTSAWAVGDYIGRKLQGTLIEHWNGKAWKIQPSPNRGGPHSDNVLDGVAPVSASDVWAVGEYSTCPGCAFRTLVEYWNGKAWMVPPSPAQPGGLNPLFGVAATSPNNAWAVGTYVDSKRAEQTLVEHWNGEAWTVQPSPNPGGSANDNELFGVAATSPNNAWAVGYYFYKNGVAGATLVEHWNGKAWTVQPSPSPGGAHAGLNDLYGVAATSATNAWAVGSYQNRSGTFMKLVLRWNGTSWTH